MMTQIAHKGGLWGLPDMRSTSKYLEQFDRMKRWHQRFVEINEGREHDRPSDYYLDDVLAFFINCHHLKDWIKNDDSVRATADVEKFINNHVELCLCADICNGIKHLILTRQPRSDQDPRFGPRHYHAQLGGTPTTISVKYSIDTTSGSVDAFELATKCLQAWEKFIDENINDSNSGL